MVKTKVHFNCYNLYRFIQPHQKTTWCYGMTQTSNQEKLKHPLCVRKHSLLLARDIAVVVLLHLRRQNTAYSCKKQLFFIPAFYTLLECIIALLNSQSSAFTALKSLSHFVCNSILSMQDRTMFSPFCNCIIYKFRELKNRHYFVSSGAH